MLFLGIHACIYQQFFVLDLQFVVMNQTDFTCVISSWPQAADHWAFITPSNSILVTTGQMLTGQNFTFGNLPTVLCLLMKHGPSQVTFRCQALHWALSHGR